MANELHEEIGKVSHQLRNCTDPEARERLTAKLVNLSTRLTSGGHRQAEFDTEGADDFTPGGVKVKSLYERAARTDEEKETAHNLDRLYLLGEILHRDPRTTKTFRSMLDASPTFKKTLDTGAGADWIPTEFSSSFHAKVRLAMEVVGLMEQVVMPTASYKLPVEGADARSYIVGEQGDVDADLDASKRIKGTLSSPALTNVTLNAVKLGCRTAASMELVEESAVPMLNYLLEKIARALAEAREDAVINGKKAGGLDADVTTADDARRAWNGLRFLALDAAYGNGVTVKQASTAGRLEVTDLRSLRAKMKKFAARTNAGDVVLVTGAAGYNMLLNLTDGNGNPIISTLEKYGQQATLIAGELARIDGMPVVLSNWVREDLAHNGLYDGITTDSSLLLMVNTKQFLFGTYRNPSVRSQPLLVSDQVEIFGLQRCDFQPWFPTSAAGYPVGYVYDMRLA